MLRAHDKCAPPEALVADKVEATLHRATGVLTLDFVGFGPSGPSGFLKSVCALPIRKWKVEIECSGSATLRPLALKIDASPTVDKQQAALSVSSPIDKKWLKSALTELGSEASFTLQVCAVNALRDEGPMSDFLPVVLVGNAPMKAPSVAGTVAGSVAGSRAEAKD
jgi:hypothetical protein